MLELNLKVEFEAVLLSIREIRSSKQHQQAIVNELRAYLQLYCGIV